MRHDLYYGAIISLGIHFGLASLNPARTVRISPPKDKEPVWLCEFTTEKPIEELSPGDAEEKPSARNDLNPPSIPDSPQVARPDSIIVPVRPAVEGKVDPKLATLPENFGKKPGAGGPDGIFETTSLDQQPVAKFQAKPVYPFAMKRSGESGEVLIDFIVDERGEVRNAYAVKSTNREFEQAAVQAVSKWKFRPGKKAGHTVGTHMQVPIVFHLGQDGE